MTLVWIDTSNSFIQFCNPMAAPNLHFQTYIFQTFPLQTPPFDTTGHLVPPRFVMSILTSSSPSPMCSPHQDCSSSFLCPRPVVAIYFMKPSLASCSHTWPGSTYNPQCLYHSHDARHLVPSWWANLQYLYPTSSNKLYMTWGPLSGFCISLCWYPVTGQMALQSLIAFSMAYCIWQFPWLSFPFLNSHIQLRTKFCCFGLFYVSCISISLTINLPHLL